MDDKDSLYFSFDDQDEPQAKEDDAKQEEGQNRTFLIGAIALAAVFIIGICAVVAYLFVIQPQLAAGGQGDPSGIALTNEANLVLFAQTQTAQFEEQSAVTEPPASPTNAPQTTATPTSGLVAVTPKTPVSAVVSGTPGTPGTGGLGGAQPTAGTPGTGTPSIIEVTPLGGTPGGGSSLGGGSGATATAGTAKATSSIIEVTSSGGSGGGQQATGVGGPIGPTIQATLPNTGFTGSAGLAGAGLLAVMLVAVVLVVRRIRLNS
jgi:LPXTG-motif cell wall-anchored protein